MRSRRPSRRARSGQDDLKRTPRRRSRRRRAEVPPAPRFSTTQALAPAAAAEHDRNPRAPAEPEARGRALADDAPTADAARVRPGDATEGATLLRQDPLRRRQ